MIARVQPLTTTRRLAGPFDYALPDAVVRVGSIVRIPFGRQALDGVVVGLAEATEVPEAKLVTPTAVREDSVPDELVELALWMADEYCSTPARALSLVLPPRGRPRSELWAARTEAPLEGERLTAGQRALIDELPRAAGADLAALRRLEARGLVAIAPRARRRAPLTVARADDRVTLTAAQEAALASVGRGGAWLLHGVTGSGKTEVYLRAAAAALERGEGVIVLVPEIALTPQTVGRFRARFGDTVALLHSALAEGERYDEWRRLRAGEARIAIGPRSAVFAPVHDLGLIVIDEEHDSSYKHEGDPRYDARHVAAERARAVADAGALAGAGGARRSGAVAGAGGASGARLLAGSATPRPETWHALPRLTLSERVASRPLPPVEVLDMRGARHPLHPETRRALGGARKAILLLNRRGWSNFLTCRSCAKVWECPQCDVALVLHRAEHAVACHHCGHRERVPARCDACGSPSVARYGAGTERLESELAAALDVPVFRLDADTAGAKDAVPELLARFAAAPAGLLVGTQMVAKGHDFPDVTLGVVVDADATLRFPDFRAEERTFALIAQLAGRAGRGPRGGRVLVQTTAPDAPAIAAAARHDTPAFVAGELERRRALDYPPFADLIRVVCSARMSGPPRAAAGEIADAVTGARGATVLGPAPLFRLRGRHRSQVVVKAHDRAAAVDAVRTAVDRAANRREHRGVAFSVDVDPQ
ncbi:MAG TPA: primosomal protein N' [Solirubrobacteraceae bacterium]|nr:primosomal protein N' [Solirubrobacteraceae bacterium]